MGVVTSIKDWPAAGRPFTVADLGRMPADGRRYELLDGVLVVSPHPATVHQVIVSRLLVVLGNACPPELCVVVSPAVVLSKVTEFDPDLVVVPADEVGGAKVTKPPLLVADVRSPSTALIDLDRKKSAYARFGVQSYWVVVPDGTRPELVLFELAQGHYVEVAHVSGDSAVTAERPFPVDVVPSRLVAGLPQDQRRR